MFAILRCSCFIVLLLQKQLRKALLIVLFSVGACKRLDTSLYFILRKALLIVLFSVGACKRLDTSLYFIFTNFHTGPKSQVKAKHDANFLAQVPNLGY